MLGRHSWVRCAVCLPLLAPLFAGACAQSGADNEHGPTYMGGDSGSDATQQDTGAPDEGTSEAGGGEGGVDGGIDSAADTNAGDSTAVKESGGDAPAESSGETGSDAGFVPPVCDGVIGASEYGGVGNEQTSSNGQIWYMTWDATNLYLAISSATVAEADILYVAVNPGDGGAGLTAGYPYDNTDVTRLPFAGGLVVYAKQGYHEYRTAGATAWGAASTGTVQFCTTGAAPTVREEVIPWSLIGGLPGAFGWTGYLAAAPASNLSGFIYGQMPIDDPGGADAGGESFTRYYAVPNATPGVDKPFADEQ